MPMPASEKPFSSGDSLKGKLLIAMPHMADSRFEKAVIVMLEHSADGAMGLLINKSLPSVDFNDLMQQLDIQLTDKHIDCPVLFGGPVEIGRGFILHSPDKMLSQSLLLTPDIALTTFAEMLSVIAQGAGPKDKLFCLGYAGWGASQLDDEIKENAWLYTDLNADIFFQMPLEKRWDAAMALAGIDPNYLTSSTGHA
jgi:putative transcriptional regulator